jgi:3-phosphoshikimate 1-carboxyvinyltransferase
METVRIKPAKSLRGEVRVPGDKSVSHRAVMLASISEGRSEIKGFLSAGDTLRSAKAFESMGIKIEGLGTERLVIDGKGLNGLKEPGDVLDLGNSGTSMRLLAGLLSGQRFFSVLTGDDSLRKRPMKRVTSPLRQMGAEINGRDDAGFAPLAIKGRTLRSIEYESPVPSAQVKSSILLAGIYAEGKTKVKEPGKSRDHTERMLRASGAEIKEYDLTVSIKGRPTLMARNIEVPGDFSSAAFFIVAGILVPDSEVIMKNVGVNPTRTGLLDILKRMKAEIHLENLRDVGGEPVADISVKSGHLGGAEIKGNEILKAIDEFPILCVAASLSEGETVIREAAELRLKESDRISAMTKELRKMGVEIEEFPDGIRIKGRERLRGAVCNSHGDHRVAMAIAIAGLLADGETVIEDTEWISTSFPGFIEILNGLRNG